MQSRVGDLQAGYIDGFLTVKQYVDVNQPRAVPFFVLLSGLSAQFRFQLFDSIQQSLGGDGRGDFQHAVEVRSLASEPPRLGLVNGRGSEKDQIPSFERFFGGYGCVLDCQIPDTVGQVLLATTQI